MPPAGWLNRRFFSPASRHWLGWWLGSENVRPHDCGGRSAEVPSTEQRIQLQSLLSVPEDARLSTLDRLRRAPTRVSGHGMVEALRRLEEVRALGVGELGLKGIPAGRFGALARYGCSVRAQAISRMREDRRIATLLAVARELEVRATDDGFGSLQRAGQGISFPRRRAKAGACACVRSKTWMQLLCSCARFIGY